MARGGKRQGAGRPVGTANKPRLLDYFTDKEIAEVIVLAKKRMKTNDRVLIHVIEQLCGKPSQPLSGDPTQPLIVRLETYGGAAST